MSYDAMTFLAGLFGNGAPAGERLQALPDFERRPSDSPATAPAGCPVCGSARTVCGARSLWCRDCADAGRETSLGPIPAAGSDGRAAQRQDGDAPDWQEYIGPDGWRCLVRSDAADLEIIDAKPCPVCGGLERWQDLVGGWHCERCEPRTQATWLREHAQRLWERHERNPRR